MSEVLAALSSSGIKREGSVKFKVDWHKLQRTFIKNGKMRMTDLGVEFQKNMFRNNGLIGYKALKIKRSKEHFCNAAPKGHV